MKKQQPGSVSVLKEDKAMHSLSCWLAALLAIALCSRVYALGGDHPANQPVNLDKAPTGLNELINQTNRVHGFFVNAEDRFFFVGDTAVDLAAGNAAGIKTVLLDKELKALSDIKWWLDGKEKICKEACGKAGIEA